MKPVPQPAVRNGLCGTNAGQSLAVTPPQSIDASKRRSEIEPNTSQPPVEVARLHLLATASANGGQPGRLAKTRIDPGAKLSSAMRRPRHPLRRRARDCEARLRRLHIRLKTQRLVSLGDHEGALKIHVLE